MLKKNSYKSMSPITCTNISLPDTASFSAIPRSNIEVMYLRETKAYFIGNFGALSFLGTAWKRPLQTLHAR